MKHIVSFSGGACSAMTALRVAEKHGTGNMVLLFADTLIEDEDLYRFNDDFSQKIGVPITRICEGRSPWEIFLSEKYIANTRVSLCSRILKKDLIWDWIKANNDPVDTTIYLGIDWTEQHRVEPARKANPGWNIEFPMCEAPYIDKQQMIKELERIGVKPPRLYNMGFAHNNCGGFCVKSGQAQFKLLLEKLPERYAHHEAQEQAWMMRTRKNNTILRDRRGGKTKSLSLEEFRLRIEAMEKIDEFDFGGCGCSVD